MEESRWWGAERVWCSREICDLGGEVEGDEGFWGLKMMDGMKRDGNGKEWCTYDSAVERGLLVRIRDKNLFVFFVFFVLMEKEEEKEMLNASHGLGA